MAISELERLRAATPGIPDAVLVEDLIERLGQDLELTPPTNLHLAASYQQIGEIRVAEMDWAGMLTPSPDGTFCITVRASDRPHRRNFTIAHEIVHTFLPGYSVVQHRCGADGPISRLVGTAHLEGLADVGAAELLLPRRFLREEFADAPLEVPAIKRLADRHHASLSATLQRLLRLDDRPGIFVELRRVSRADGEPETLVHRVFSNTDWCAVAPYQLHGLQLPRSHPIAAVLDTLSAADVVDVSVLGTKTRLADVSALCDPYTDHEGNLVMRALLLATPHHQPDLRIRLNDGLPSRSSARLPR